MPHYCRVFLMLLLWLGPIGLSSRCEAQEFEGTHLSSSVPPYPVPPLTYENNHILMITFKTSRDVLRALVPAPLVPNPNDLMTVYVGRFNIVHPEQIAYLEAGISVPASYGEKEGSFMPVLYVDKVLPITIGREIWGFPKFQADISLEVEDGMVHASVASDGNPLIGASLRLREPIPPTDLLPSHVFLLKSIPSAQGGSTRDVKQLTSALIRDADTVVRPGEAMLKLGSTASDPLGSIPVLELVRSVYSVGGFVLDYGEVLHDYLEEDLANNGSSEEAR